ncbi:Transport and Golgi organization protein 2-like protein [Colletotrichum truncatum]|uniref:Transport and Golgi organization protein 2-like protein n=1 Tax=Colletotrichum truncatum TaxID=5467 RepID=A0ACC3YPQ8_COLTU|nr:Transport and Golgi organization protein 2-like protein [Colletotrichum truncatum]KAF6796859.1 Transport and Golgi organization protein 2-like protein [Colletotrichum truncatum]
MCIVLLTTAHPDYAVIVVDNRDEFILRPTSRPHWWSHPSGASVLSARDLQREEKGTWLGITKTGQLAVLTNYRETDPGDASHPIHAARSRGGMVTAWLGSDPTESASETVNHLVKDGGVKGVGGFSMVAGKLRRKRGNDEKPVNALEGIAIVSNRCDNLQDVPWIAEERDQVYGLSNTVYNDPKQWPKVENGKRLIKEAIEDAVSKNLDEDALVDQLFAVLDTDTLPKHPDMSLADYIKELKQSIFIPAIGDEVHRKAMQDAVAKGRGNFATDDQKAAESLQLGERPDPPAQANLGFEVGLYGTQRQTIIMVDWDGNVSYRERALWDGNGNAIERGKGDEVFRFKIEGWEN